MSKAPNTLFEAVALFSDDQTAFGWAVKLRWPDGVVCPRCECKEHNFIATRQIWKCKGCKRQFSVKVGSIFEDSPIKMGKWLSAIWLVSNAKNGISSYEVHRAIGVTQKTAWFMLHRIREAMNTGSFNKPFTGEVEVDETFVGGKRSNMHKSRKVASGIKGRGMVGKAVVMGLLERGGEVRAMTVKDTKKRTLCFVVLDIVEPGSTVYTDALSSYEGIEGVYNREVIDHKVSYAEGNVHVNGIENFWSLFKRCIKGTYIHVGDQHLDSYLDEETYRFNTRKVKDSERFTQTVNQVSGKRLTYKELIARS